MPTSVRTTVPAVCTARQKLQLLHCDVSLSRNHGRTCSLSPCGYGVQRRPPFLLLVAQDQPAPQPQPHTPPLRVAWTLALAWAWVTTRVTTWVTIRGLNYGAPRAVHPGTNRSTSKGPRGRIQDQTREAVRGARTGANSKSTARCSRPPAFATWEGRWRVEGDHTLRLFRRAAGLGAIFRDGAMRPYRVLAGIGVASCFLLPASPFPHSGTERQALSETPAPIPPYLPPVLAPRACPRIET